MSEQRIFGTDGIRGRAGEGWLSPERVSALGRAVGHVLAPRASRAAGAGGGEEPPRALLGHDGRRSGPDLEAALARGLLAAGCAPVSAGLITTPGLAWLGHAREFPITVMISASHNPARDNGIKLFGAGGEKLSNEAEDRIEAECRAHMEPADSGPRPEYDASLELAYLEHLQESAGDLALDGLKLVLDCANGGGSRVAPRVLSRLGAEVITTAAEPDGDNINAGCGATAPAALQGDVRRAEADLGIALDGDGDRCILVDELGQLVHGDGILTLLALHGMRERSLTDPRIVATVMSNRGLHRALREAGVGVETVGVGDRQVVERLRAEGLSLGGEQSGHIVFGEDNHHIGDGVYTALRVLRVMQTTGRSLSELAAPYQPFPQILINVPVAKQPSLAEIPAVMELVRNIEEELGEDGRVLLRYSGTEPLARVMVEGPDGGRIGEQARTLAGVIARELGA